MTVESAAPPRRRRRLSLAAFCIAGAALAGLCRAQTRPPDPAPPRAAPPRQATPGELEPAAEQDDDPERARHETEAQTIAKCLADLEKGDVTLRRRAILILGKYRAPAAQAGVIRSLTDPDDRVRQSALVAVSEQLSRPGLLASAAREAVIARLADPNVHIRRIASSLAKDVLGPAGLGFRVSGAVRIKRASPDVDSETVKVLNDALLDEDPIVRKNVLALYPYVRGVWDSERFVTLFEDPDTEIRVLALRAFSEVTNLTAADHTDVLAPLVDDPEPQVREQVVQTLERSGKFGVPLLREFVDDPDPSVRSRAIKRLTLLRDSTAMEHVVKALRDESIALDERVQLVRFVFLLDHQKRLPLLTDLAENATLPVRAEAIRGLGRLGKQGPPAAFYLRLLQDASAEIRNAALLGLSRRLNDVEPTQVAAMQRSEYADVRMAALQLAGKLPPDEAADLIVDSLLDDEIEIRCQAIATAARRAIPGWHDLLAQSLKDPSVEIQRAAADALLKKGDPESLAIVKKFVAQCKIPELAAYIRTLLYRVESKGRVKAMPRSRTPRGARLPLRRNEKAPKTVPQRP